MTIIVGWLKVNEETDGLDVVENVFADEAERTAFFEAEIQTGLVFDWQYMVEGSTPEQYEDFAKSNAALRESLGDEYDRLFPGGK